MGLLKLMGRLAVLGLVAAAALAIVGKVRQSSGRSPQSTAAAPSEAGFVMINPDYAKVPHVMVMAAENCPREEATRARALAAAIQAAGVPCRVESNFSIQFTDQSEAERVQRFMEKVSNPLVIVRGRAKGNPTINDVLAEYRAAH